MANYLSAYTGAQIDTAISKINNLLNLIYPVGSIYMSVNATNPATFIGGTWARITDCFLLASGNSYAPGSTGGEANVTLSTNTIPPHAHTLLGIEFGTLSTDTCLQMLGDGNLVTYSVKGGTWHATWAASWCPTLNVDLTGGSHYYNWTIGAGQSVTQNNGGGYSHNNMPPYLAVYVWQRTA